ncbi:TetR family transcriptional regulator [Lysinibacter sp. HNR]|uniref:TetR/AcrR family transcriptional regulator n=1 Tax=Lysinibacter sp. HNR TaxID=3031408 RepID=UPI002435BEB4|nr:TetR family transcriptional regulator [Lysinibacter sp. HNR]WGD37471.1 TetR family transcriptional regulator [Lysinibacter sp. HNR]
MEGVNPRDTTPTADLRARTESARRQKTRDRLIDAAFEEFAERGISAASVESISERAGFTRGAFYSNFSSKEELFFALMERENTKKIEALDADIAAVLPQLAADPLSLTEELVARVAQQALQGQVFDRRWCLVQEEFALLALRSEEVAAEYRVFREKLYEGMAEVVQYALATAGLTFKGDPIDVIKLLSGMHEFAIRGVLLDPESEESIDRMLSLLPQIILGLVKPVDAGSTISAGLAEGGLGSNP